MQIFVVFIILSFIVFTYSLYLLGREDVIFIRKNVTLEQLFNILFITIFISTFFARLIFVILHYSSVYLNPFNFFSFISMPGMSLIGGVMSGSLFLAYYLRLRKLPLGRIFDFFALSFFSAIPVAVFGSFFLSKSIRFTESIFLPILYLILFIFLLKFIFPKLLQGALRSGSIGLLVVLLFSLILFLTSMVKNRPGVFGFVTVEDIIAIVSFFVCLFLIIKQEGRGR